MNLSTSLYEFTELAGQYVCHKLFVKTIMLLIKPTFFLEFKKNCQLP